MDFFDVEDSGQAIGELLDDPGERESLAAAAAQRARDYSSVDGLKHWLQLIEL